MTPEQRDEIKRCIAFYEERGWDWGDIVAYLAMKHTGRWPPPPSTPRRAGGRPRKTDPAFTAS